MRVSNAYAAFLFSVDLHCDCSHPVDSLSFSHDGEYIAISSEGSYVDIVSQCHKSSFLHLSNARFSAL